MGVVVRVESSLGVCLTIHRHSPDLTLKITAISFISVFICSLRFQRFQDKWFQDSEDFEDDIILTKSQKALIDNPRSAMYHDDLDLRSSAAVVLWPENTIPYYVPPSLGKNFVVILYHTTISFSYFCHVKNSTLVYS